MDNTLSSNSLLIADPSLVGGVFERSVIHLSEYDKEKGAEGHILNRPTDKRVGDVLTAPQFAPLKSVPIYFGGPVGVENLSFSVYWWEEGLFYYSLRISAEEATELNNLSGSFLFAHIGYTSWDVGQLEREMLEGSWITADVSERTLSTESSEKWRTLLSELSPYHQLLSLTPRDVQRN